MNKQKPTHITIREGTSWITWDQWQKIRDIYEGRIHSIKFEDGNVFDAVNGWRSEEHLALLSGEKPLG